MQRQFTLWPLEGSAAAPPIREDLDEPEQTRLIVALARLIRQAAEPHSAGTSVEDSHER
jgi:hypothetical protein